MTGSGRPAAGCSDAAGLQHVLHAAAAQHGHSQEEAQHQTIQGYALYGLVFEPLLFNSKRTVNQDQLVLSHSVFGLGVISLLSRSYFVPGGAVLSA